MRLIELKSSGELGLTKDYTENIPRYAILSHTWGGDNDEVTFADFVAGTGLSKAGYRKIEFCRTQAAKDGLRYFWVDTCCIDKSNHAELSEAINSMFRWYRDAVKCYVYLVDVSSRGPGAGESISRAVWGLEFRQSRWFTRAWTLQELIAPAIVEFFSWEGEQLGSKTTLEVFLKEVTGIPIDVFRGRPLAEYPVNQWMIWATERTAKKKEDEAYCLLGIFDVHMSLHYGEGRAEAFARLHSKIRERLQTNIPPPNTSTERGNVHWMVPRPLNNLFTGRAELVSRIQQALRQDVTSETPSQKRFVITGLGGQGKSELCLQVANVMRKEFWGVFWIDAGTQATAERDFITVAKTIGRSVQSIPEALQVLAAADQSWLLVLDNADDPDFDYQDYLPPGKHGAVIITSRDVECKQYSPDAFEALQGLEGNDSKELLLKGARIPQDAWSVYKQPAEEVIHLLGSHTLALIQAGAYIAQGHCQLHEYPQEFRRQRDRLMKYHSKKAKSRYRHVYATFEASAEKLENSSSEVAIDALCLLGILAMLGPSYLPLQIFQDAWNGCKDILHSSRVYVSRIDKFTQDHVSTLPRFMSAEDNTWDAYRLIEATSLLTSLSLVTRYTQDGLPGISMHPLTHAWAKDRQNPEEQGVSWITTGCVLGFSRKNMQMWLTQERKLLPHIQSYLDIKIDKMYAIGSQATLCPILIHCGWALLDMRQHSRLGHLLEGMFLKLRVNSKELSEEFLSLYDIQAQNLYYLGKTKEAIKLLEHVVKTRGITQAKARPSRMAPQVVLSAAYQANGQVKEAIALFQQIIKIEGTILAEDHPDRLASQHELARAYEANGQVKEAVALLQHVVKIRETTLAEDHPDRVLSEQCLAYYMS